jgi:hypothetical protein
MSGIDMVMKAAFHWLVWVEWHAAAEKKPW